MQRSRRVKDKESISRYKGTNGKEQVMSPEEGKRGRERCESGAVAR